MKKSKTKILSLVLAFLMACSSIIPGAELIVPAEANTPTLIAPIYGTHLEDTVVYTYLSQDETYAIDVFPNSHVITDYYWAWGKHIIYPGPANHRVTGQSQKSGQAKGILRIELDDAVKNLDAWDYACLDFVQTHTRVYGEGTAKAYLVEDYDFDTLTWNTFPATIENTPEVTFVCGGGQNQATRGDITALVEFAVANGMDAINIAVEIVEGASMNWTTSHYTGDANTIYNVALQLLTTEGSGAIPMPTPTPTTIPGPTPAPTPESDKIKNLVDPIYGTNLYEQVLATYISEAGTTVASGFPNAVMSDLDWSWTQDYLNIGYASQRLKGTSTSVSGAYKSIIRVEIDNYIEQLDWNLACLDMFLNTSRSYGMNKTKAYLVGDYDATTVTWNTFPKAIEGAPAVEFTNGGSVYEATRGDITDLVKYAVEHDMTTLNIALECSDGYLIGIGFDGTPTQPRVCTYETALRIMNKTGIITGKIAGGDCAIDLGEVKALECSVIEDGLVTDYAYSSSDSSVVSVTTQGVMTGIKEGEADIILTMGGFTTSIHVTVKDFQPTKPIYGTLLENQVLCTYEGKEGSYVCKEYPTSVMKKESQYPDYQNLMAVGTHQQMVNWEIKNNTNNKSVFRVELDEKINELNWDYAALDLTQVFGNVKYNAVKIKAYLVGNYDPNIITWNNFPAVVADTPVVEFNAGGDNNKGTRCDITELIRFAAENDMTTLNIALEVVEGPGISFGTSGVNNYYDIGDIDADPQLVLLAKELTSNLVLGDIRFLDLKDEFGNDISYVSSNPDVVSISDDAVLNAIALGEADIIVTSGVESYVIHMRVQEDNTNEDMKLLIERSKEIYLTQYNTENAITNLSNSAERLLDSMYEVGVGNSEGYLWEMGNFLTNTMPAAKHMENIQVLAYAFMTEGTTVYQNPEIGRLIMSAIDYVTCTGEYLELDYIWSFDGEFPYDGNWYEFCVTAPLILSRVLLMMEPYFDDSELIKYIDIVTAYVSDPTKITGELGNQWSDGGANLANMSSVYLLAGLVIRNDDMIYRLTEADCLSSLMTVKEGYSNWGNGAYEDGTYIYHSDTTQNLSYGVEVISGVYRFNYIFGNTKYDFDKETLGRFQSWVLEAFLPVLYKGKGMSMMAGRGASCIEAQRANGGNEVRVFFSQVASLLNFVENADSEYRTLVRSAIKWNLEELIEFYGEDVVAGNSRALSLLADESVEAMPYLEGIKVYGAGTRVVQAAERYTAALQLMNNHMSSYEYINLQDRVGFYRGAGTLWVYNEDLDQFGYYYWPTYDPYRLAGVTADTTELPDGTGQSEPPKTFIASGATDGTIASIAFDFSADYLGLNTKAKKSYFFLEEGIVQMGTEISGTTQATIETTIEARLLNNDGSNRVLINGKEFDGTRQTMHLEAGSWIHMEGNVEGADMAYYFPEATDIEIAKEYCTGSYQKGAETASNTKYSKWYLKIGINHGTGNVSGGRYLYVTLPGLSVEEIENYVTHNSLEVVDGVVENGNSLVHAIKNNSGTMLAVNSYTDKEYSIDWLTMSSNNGKASVLVTEKAGVYTMSIADSSYSNNSTVSIATDYAMNVISKDDEITIAADNKSIVVDTAKAGGHSFQIRFTLEGKEPTVVPVAQIGDVEYETLQAALNEVKADEVITLLASIDLSEEAIMHSQGIIDLNGKTLTASSFIAFSGAKVVDNSEEKTGVLKSDDVAFLGAAATDAQMPIYNGTDGYVFADVKRQELGGAVVDDIFNLTFKPSFGTKNSLLVGGGDAVHVSIIIRLEWIDANGKPQSRDLEYIDENVRQVYGESMAFYISASGVGNFEDLTITPVVKSDIGVEWLGTTFVAN